MSDTSDSSAKSDSTQWPSAPNSPSENEMSDMQDLLDRAMRDDHSDRDPFESNPEMYHYLRSHFQEHCRLAARRIHDAEVLLVVTGAGFSADSGLATYLDVADIEAYSSKGWKYRDLCQPPVFANLDIKSGRQVDPDEAKVGERPQDEVLSPNEASEDAEDETAQGFEHPSFW